jgi:hypothetical protein
MPVKRSGWVTLVAVLYLISGLFNLLIGIAALGVTLSGSATVDGAYLGDWPTDDLEAAAVVLIVFAAFQVALGGGIMNRARWAWMTGLIISTLVVVTHLYFSRLLDGWAIGGLFTNLAIILILALRADEFRLPEQTGAA